MVASKSSNFNGENYEMSLDGSPIALENDDRVEISKETLIDMFSNSISGSKQSARSSSSKGNKQKHSSLATDAMSAASKEAGAIHDFIFNSTLYIKSRGFPVNSFSLNGMVKDSADLGNGLMQLLGREQFYLSQLVQKGVLTDRTKSIYTTIMQNEKRSNYDSPPTHTPFSHTLMP
jgi:hypothetical protein